MTKVCPSALFKSYPGSARPAVENLMLDVPSGGLVALPGPSGRGKTTAQKLIAGLLDPTSGDIAFDRRSILPDRPETRNAVMVFQNHLLFRFMSVADKVDLVLHMRHLPKARIAERVAAMLAPVDPADLGQRQPAALSGGQQQRVALARALIVQPDVLLLDESLSGLDAHLRTDMRAGILTFRPEMVRIGQGAVKTLHAVVDGRQYHGTQILHWLAVGDVIIEAVLSPDSVEGIAPGQPLAINLPPPGLWVMPPA